MKVYLFLLCKRATSNACQDQTSPCSLGPLWTPSSCVAVPSAVPVPTRMLPRVVDEVLGHLLEGQHQGIAKALVGHLFGQGHAHAQQPLFAGLAVYGVRRVAHAQSGVAPVFHEQGWAAQPARQEHEQAFFAARQALRVHLAHGPGLGQLVHQLVKAVHQLAQGGCAAQLGVGGDGGRGVVARGGACGCGRGGGHGETFGRKKRGAGQGRGHSVRGAGAGGVWVCGVG